MYTVNIAKPNGTTRQAEAKNIREVGQIVAFALHYGANVSQKEATRYGMTAERDRQLSAHGYTFTVNKGAHEP